MSAQDEATICKSNSTRINSINTNSVDCANSTEIERRKTFATDTGKQKDEIENLKSVYVDTIASADSIFGGASTKTFVDDINKRNAELKQRLSDLKTSIDRSKAAIERADRDFVDSKEQLPEQLPTKTAHVIDDYTLLILFISYLFFALTVLYWYVQQNGFTLNSLLTGLAVGIIGSGILAMLLWTYL
jgi:hypothetical protein